MSPLRWNISAFTTRFFATQKPSNNSTPSKIPQDSQVELDETEGNKEELIVEVTRSNFSEIVEGAKPVILNCYVENQPVCKKLTGMLIKVVTESNGALRLANLNVENYPEIAQQLQATHVPTVVGVYQGGIVDRFVGIQKDDIMQSFVTKLMKLGGGENVSQILQQADQFLKEGNIEEARRICLQLLHDKQLRAGAQALAGLARCAIQENKLEDAKELVDTIKAQFPNDLTEPEVRKAIAALDLQAKPTAETETLLNTVNKDPNDLQARYDLAIHYFQTGKHEDALNQCYAIIKKNKVWQQEAARRLAINIFDALGPADEIVKKGKRKLTNLWFI